MSRSAYFVIPETSQLPSGGNLYNAHLLAALQQQGVRGMSLRFEQFEQDLEGNEGAFYWIDTLYLRRLAPVLKKSALGKVRIGLIVHHLESMYPGEQDPVALWTEERILLQYFSGFLATSEFTQAYLIQHGIKPERIGVIPPAAHVEPIEIQNPLAAKTSSPPSPRLRALIVANWVARKGIREFLQELLKQQAHWGDFHVTLIGAWEIEPDYAAYCKRLIDHHSPLASQITYTGALPQQKVWELYPQHDLFISPAYMETFGMAIQEAQCAGLPLLVMEGGYSAKHIREGENGFLFTDMQELVKTFLRLSRNSDAWQRLKQRAQRNRPAPTYTWGHAAQKFITLLDQLTTAPT